ncbi:unnamed protein product [Brassica oleracea var. botrytis]|uniref:(rape) hypothetical protein n=1 Tax=Brassica napus TaxID=3708 RepID=A0A816L980_BRANA|nr:unnamed protein product [Brassica napus]
MVSEPDPCSPIRSIIDPVQIRPIDPCPNIPRLTLKEPSSRGGVLGINVPHRILKEILTRRASNLKPIGDKWSVHTSAPQSLTCKVERTSAPSSSRKSKPFSDEPIEHQRRLGDPTLQRSHHFGRERESSASRRPPDR